MADPAFWSQQRVLLTGHTGFKGAWLSVWLSRWGAQVFGYSLAPETEPALWNRFDAPLVKVSTIADVRDSEALRSAVDAADPTIVMHLAAQPLVRRSYRMPVDTFTTNVDGTINLLDCLRGRSSLRAVLVVTTDKVYRNLEDGRAFREDDPLGAHDPYSASKAAAEIAVASWAQSFFADAGIPVVTARAGNVIGGGDWSEDRIVPDIWRAVQANRQLVLRSPDATRPWQHVIEPLAGYLQYVEACVAGSVPSALNFGPYPDDILTVGDLAASMLDAFGATESWKHDGTPTLREMKTLSLDPTLAGKAIGWRPLLSSRDAVAWTAEWYRRFKAGDDVVKLCLEQISRYEKLQAGKSL